MQEFKEMHQKIDRILGDMIEAEEIACCNMYTNNYDRVVIHFLEEDGNKRLHPTMKRLAERLYDEFGRHFILSHNDPTDGTVEVFLFEHDDLEGPYDPNECCMKSFLRGYETFKERGGTWYETCYKVVQLLEENTSFKITDLDPNENFHEQLLKKMLDFHC